MLALTADGLSIAYPMRTVTGADAIRTKIQIRMGVIAGEWLSDTNLGIPESYLFGPTPTVQQAEAWLRSQLRAVNEVETIQSLVATFSGGSLSFTATVTAKTDGELVTLTIGEPLPYDTRGLPAHYQTSGDLLYGRGTAWQGS